MISAALVSAIITGHCYRNITKTDEFLLKAIAAVAVACEHIIAGQQSWFSHLSLRPVLSLGPTGLNRDVQFRGQRGGCWEIHRAVKPARRERVVCLCPAHRQWPAG